MEKALAKNSIPPRASLGRARPRWRSARSLRFLGAVLAAAAGAFAEEPALALEKAPLAEELPSPFLEVEKRVFWKEQSARRALSLGLGGIAAELAAEALAALPEGEGRASRERLTLLRIDGLLAEGEVEAAMRAIAEVSGRLSQATPRLALRAAMAAYAKGDVETVRERLSLLEEAVFGDREERAWARFLRGWLSLSQGRQGEAANAFARMRELSAELVPAARAGLDLSVFEARLRFGDGQGQADIAALRAAYEEALGEEVSYRYAQQLAARLAEAGRADEAIALVEEQLTRLPAVFERLREEFLLLQTLAAGIEREEGRRAAGELVVEGKSPELMRVALQLAARTAMEPGAPQASFLEESLDAALATPDHPLAEEALYYRGVFRLYRERYEEAIADAEALRSRFSASPYGQGALALLASAAWERERYRTAASHLSRLREDHLAGRRSALAAALMGDCYFRAGKQAGTREDFLNAAEAYSAALAAMPAGEMAGRAFYQLVVAYLEAGDFERALTALDNPETVKLAPPQLRWRAEWMASKRLRQGGELERAYRRTRQVLATAQLSEGLRLRFLWLATKLSLEAGRAEETDDWAARLNAFLDATAAEAFAEELLTEVRSSALLALAEARFSLGESEQALALLEELRDTYAGSQSALFSYIAQARHYAELNRTVEAQQLLVYLADNFPESRLAPMALYEAALNAEKRGQDAFLSQANQLLERIAADYPDSEMVYYARLKQADLLRKLNKFGAAEQIYAYLENAYRGRPDRYLAQISLADTLMAQASENPAAFEAALSRLELLFDLPEVPLDLRMEAGYKIGLAWRNQGERRRAKQAFWTLYDRVALEGGQVEALGPQGRYWLARALFGLAELSVLDKDIDAASNLYQRVVTLQLWGKELAQARLERLR